MAKLLTAKNIAIFFGLATIAFMVATIVLAVEKSSLEDELQDALDKLDLLSTMAPAPTAPSVTPTTDNPSTVTPTNEPSTGSTGATGSTASTGSTATTGSTGTTASTGTDFPWPTITVPTDPEYPTLPPGLPNPEQIIYRLPTELRPIKYRLQWHPDLVSKTVEATVSVQVEVDKETNLIVMHAKDLEIESISILNMMARMRIRIKQYYLRPEREMLFIELEELLHMSTPYVVSISYHARLDGLSGMYASSYLNGDGKERWIATSKFEPTYARQAFPCFDEPAMKAMFSITVVRPTGDGYHALSNMNVESEDVMGDLTEVHFAESIPMSTYLACFIVSDFAHQKKTVKGVLEDAQDFEMRVFSTAAQVNKVEYALNLGASITEFYIDYFQISYPLPKLDMAAIPDFVSGAMEHWGLVTFRETALLYDSEISSSANKQRVATVVAHELAHMWFGNLVTMKWWNDLWLNEGFASYIQYKGVNHVHPDWEMLDQFLVDDLHGVMKLDSTLASHPIVQTVESPAQITELFDAITYSKGCSIIRMLEDLIGADKFRAATTSYLNKFYLSNAETDDFLSEIEAQELDFDVKLIMQTWTEQMGLPVVEVLNTENGYKLTQKRFFSNPEDYNGTYDDSQFNYHWSIPITYFTEADPEVKRALFNYNDNELSIPVPSTAGWIKFNKNQVGFYRVNYPVAMWGELTNALITSRGSFSTADRAHLINDVFSLADASQLDYKVALDLSLYLERELDYVAWEVAGARLNAIKNLLYYTDLYRDFLAYGRKMLQQVYESVGWNVDNDHLHNLLRANILQTACAFGHPVALQEATTRFNAWLANPDERPKPDIRSTVYYYGMQSAGNEHVWQQVFDLFVKEQDAQEKVKLMSALAAVSEPWLLQRYINLAWDENNVRGQDYFTCLQYIASNRVGQSLVWDYVRENWQRMVDRFGINERYLGRMIPSITARFATQTKLDELTSFFAKYPDAGAGAAARKQALETVKYNIKWLQQNKQQVGEWLAARQDDTSTTEDSVTEASTTEATTTEANRIS